MQVPILLPDLGTEPGQPITLSVWFADKGDLVYEGDRLVEVLVSGATFDVSSPATGQLAEVFVMPDEPVRVGQVLGVVDTKTSSSARP